MEISEQDQKRLLEGEPAYILVSSEYFSEGEYSEWKENSEETKDMTDDEYQDWLVEYMRKTYDGIVVHSDGTIYGNVSGTSHDISYNDFDDVETFIELIEKYGIGEIQFQE